MSATRHHSTPAAPVTAEARSADGTTIAYTRYGDGPPLILADGAMCHRSFGPMTKLGSLLARDFTVYTYDRRGRGESGDTAPYAVEREVEDLAALIAAAGGSAGICGVSSGAALALEAAKHLPGITKLVLYEAPFIVDSTRTPMPEGYLEGLQGLIAAGRRGDAVKMFLSFVGVPGAVLRLMRVMPAWRKMTAVAPTLPYDISIVKGHQRGVPLDPAEFSAVTIPVCVLAGGKSPDWMRNGNRSLAEALRSGQHRVLPGQTHMVKAPVVAPVVREFFAT